MSPFIGLLFDMVMNFVTLGRWNKLIGDEIVWIDGDGFGRPGKD